MVAVASTPGTGKRSLPFWVEELPYIGMLLLTLGGVTYASVSPQATFDYWRILVPVFGLICIIAGWRAAGSKDARWRLVWTQVLHWAAIFATMQLLFLPNVHLMLNSDATGLAIMALLALGTFLAGVHAASWRVCVVGAFLAAAVPVAALLEQAVLIVLLVGIVLLGLFALVLWLKKRRLETPRDAHAF